MEPAAVFVVHLQQHICIMGQFHVTHAGRSLEEVNQSKSGKKYYDFPNYLYPIPLNSERYTYLQLNILHWLGKASKKVIFITLGSEAPPPESDKNIFYFLY